MKFSKVNNYKTAVTGKGGSVLQGTPPHRAGSGEAAGKTGILYRDPPRQGRSAAVNIEDHVERQTQAAQRLYRIVNAKEKGKRTVSSDISELLDKSVNKRDLSEGTLTAGKFYNSLLGRWQESGLPSSGAAIDEAVDLYLRKSLYQTSGQAVKNLLRAAAGGRRWNTLPESQRQEIEGFVDCLKRDYQYEKIKKHVVKSIEHQNIVIQPDDAGVLGPACIPLSSSRNRKEKEAMTNFLSDYADLNDEVRHGLRIRLRRLVDLYFYGAEEVPSGDFDEWEDHSARRKRTEPFSQEAVSYIALAREEDRRREAEREVKKNASARGYGVGNILQDSRNKNTDGQDKKVKKDKKDRIKAVGQMFRQENLQRYRKSISAVESAKELYFQDAETNRFWIHHIENFVERIYRNFRSLEDYRLSVGYLGEKVWKGMLVYLCGKYIATGKAVYHFAMDEGLEDPKKDLVLGKVGDEVRGGLTSFDYEQIKAEEVLQRDTAVYVAFAANHLSSATVDLSVFGEEKDKEDFLLLKREDLERAVKPCLRRNILQFFGGESTWQDFPFDKYYREYAASCGEQYDDISFLDDLKKIIYAVRNESFHFDTRRRDPGNWNQGLIAAMFSHDCKTASKQQKEKFYSNNLPMFYGEKDLLTVLRTLYEKQTTRASQVPSFNRVFVRRNFSDFIRDGLGWTSISFPGENSVSKKQQYDSALYYLLKEVYYNLFLQGRGMNGDYDVKRAFVSWCENPQNGKENEEAFRSFRLRVEEIASSKKDIALPEICQRIMTDYNQYNNKTRKVKSDYIKEKTPDSYDHFKMLLLKGIREVFAAFVKAEFGFLKAPSYREKPDADAFLPDYESPTYAVLVDRMKGNPDLQKWYVLGRLLNPRQANFFVGVLRQYVQYTGQIRRRAQETGNSTRTLAAPKSFKTYASVVDVCIQLSGMTTNCMEDYFEDKDDYARHVGNYLEFEGLYPGISPSAQLESFCNENAAAASIVVDAKETENGNSLEETGYEELKRFGIFYDAENPILNRNILLSKIYGTEAVLVNVAKNRKVTREDIHSFYAQRDKLGEYRITGKCITEEQQRSLKKYQEIKNKVEFRDLVEYEEIIDELQGQMIDWCYLRERDLMYFQLGFHYTCLNNGSPKPDLYRKIVHGSRKIDGAILYQVAALYINGLSVYSVEKGKIKSKSADMPAGGKIRVFLNYARACQEQLAIQASRQDIPAVMKKDVEGSPNQLASRGKSGNAADPESFYFSGMELFENIREHDNIVSLRNYIEHFHYYVRQDRSLLDLYGEIFDRFFTYDMKYQKNVCNILYNILMHHFVRPDFAFSTETKEVGPKEDIEIKIRASVSLRDGRGLSSEQMTYKLSSKAKEGDANVANQSTVTEEDIRKMNLDARSRDFLEGVAALLYYPNEPGNVVSENKGRQNTENSKKSGRPGEASQKGGFSNRGRRSDQSEKKEKRSRKGIEENGGSSYYQSSSKSFGTSLGDLLKGFKFDE